MSRGRREFPACDGLRALAALSVLFFHTATLTGLVDRTGAGPYYFQLDVGVDVFFVLSGFLLYRPFARAHLTGTKGPAVGRYLRRRFLRIFPAYWFVLAAVLYVFHQAAAPTTKDGLIFFGLAQIYSGRHLFGGLVPAWTLCTEISFYAFLPVYAFVLRRWAKGGSKLRAELIGVGALYIGSCVFHVVTSSQNYTLAYNWLPAYLDVFGLGMLMAVVSVAVEQGMVGQWWRSVPRDAAVWWCAAIALFVAVSNLGMPLGLVEVSPAKYFVHHLMAGTIGALLVCPAVLHEQAGGTVRNVLASRPLRALGLISYGIYLWQVPWIFQVEKWTGGHPYFSHFWPVFLLVVPLTLLSAWGTYVLIERPLLTSRPREQGGSGVAAAIPSESAAEQGRTPAWPSVRSSGSTRRRVSGSSHSPTEHPTSLSITPPSK
jgi:peptidoglycan/LPS O-acetylase OafA/YrhL